MKKIISIFLALVTLVLMIPAAQASAQMSNSGLDIIYLEDGGYIMVELNTNSNTARTTISKSKVVTRYSDDDEMQWQIRLSGSFTYNGSSAGCSSCNCTVTIYDDTWYTESKTSWANGNTANATVVMAQKLLGITVRRETVDLTLTCDKNGNFS
jgi:hypothetical protein